MPNGNPGEKLFMDRKVKLNKHEAEAIEICAPSFVALQIGSFHLIFIIKRFTFLANQTVTMKNHCLSHVATFFFVDNIVFTDLMTFCTIILFKKTDLTQYCIYASLILKHCLLYLG